MQILKQKFKNVLFPILTITAMAIPVKTGVEQKIVPKEPENPVSTSIYYPPKENCILPQDLNGLTIVTDTNYVGGISHCFDD